MPMLLVFTEPYSLILNNCIQSTNTVHNFSVDVGVCTKQTNCYYPLHLPFFHLTEENKCKRAQGVISSMISACDVMCHRELLKGEPSLYVPEVIEDLSTKHVLTTEFIHGMPLDKCADLDQDTRNAVRFPHLWFT